MKANVGGLDRTLRIIVGAAALSLVFIVEGYARWWGLVGLLPLLTGLTGFCPAYTIFGLRTCTGQRKPA